MIKGMIWILPSLTVLILADMLVISVVYHRYLTHRSVDLNKWVARALTLYIQGMAFAPPFTWVASHVAHHAHTDTPLDPYSPRVHGFWQVLFLTPLLVTRWRRRYGATITARYTRRVPDRRFYAACNRGWWCLSISSGFALGFFLLFGWPGLLVYVFQFYGFYVVKGWINSVGHTFGERPYRNSGANRRGVISSLLNLWMAGEWLHNHHHHSPGSANFGLFGETDTGYLVCRGLAFFRLATIRNAGTAVQAASAGRHSD